MLSKTQVVAVRRAVEQSYGGRCTIAEKQKVKEANKATGFVDVIILENQACKLSFSSSKSASQTELAAVLSQSTKLFLAPEIKVKPGSKLVITQNGVTTAYQSSGEPAFFATHQEIALELFEEWA